MLVHNSIKSLRKEITKLKLKKKSIGFVPTMGALHEGHCSLIQKSRRENNITILSIYVNPLQFSPNEDFPSYPREQKKDKILAKKEKVDIIFYPSDKMMYHKTHSTVVEVKNLSNVLCGRKRAGHFIGVTTVVLKLLNIVNCDRLYLGQKDGQQAIIIRKMINDLNIPVQVKVCPTVRERDGLALSSRNRYLTTSLRSQATMIYRSLREAEKRILEGERNSKSLATFIRTNIEKNSKAKTEYVEVVDSTNLAPVKIIKGKIMIALAVHLGKARLIDNIQLNVRR